MRLVVKIGGSLCFDENGPVKTYFSRLLHVLKKVKKQHQLIVSIGGGRQNRKFYESVSEFNLSGEQKEWIAIDMLRANARFLAFLLKMKPIFSIGEITGKTQGVISGIAPGRSTDANAALAAARIKADYFIKLTNVDGIYEKDPKLFPMSKKLDHVQFKDLKKYSKDGKPGSYGILDRLAMETVVKNKIKTVIMQGRDPDLLLRLLKGEKIGTLVS
jgi:uridylate kinase